jgi:hypothetical protein
MVAALSILGLLPATHSSILALCFSFWPTSHGPFSFQEGKAVTGVAYLQRRCLMSLASITLLWICPLYLCILKKRKTWLARPAQETLCNFPLDLVDHPALEPSHQLWSSNYTDRPCAVPSVGTPSQAQTTHRTMGSITQQDWSRRGMGSKEKGQSERGEPRSTPCSNMVTDKEVCSPPSHLKFCILFFCF